MEKESVIPSRKARSLVEGTIDLHVHPAPSAGPRLTDAGALAVEAASIGMRGALLKDHDRQTAAEAVVANRQLTNSNFEFFGSVCLNGPAGGINPAAVEAAIDVGCRAVFFPTDNAQNDHDFWEQAALDGTDRAAIMEEEESRKYQPLLSVLDSGGNLTAEAKTVMKLCADKDVLICTGHLGAREISAVCQEASGTNARVLVTHARILTGATQEDHASWVALGAKLEVTYVNCCDFMSERVPASLRKTVESEAAFIESLGADGFVLSTDFGQARNASPAAGYVEFLDRLLAEGISEDAIHTMTRTNPAHLLGLDRA
jgi:hypothetical protein